MACDLILSSASSSDDLYDSSEDSVINLSYLCDFDQPVAPNTKYICENDLQGFFQFEDKTALNFLHINCRSLTKNFTGLESLLNSVSGKLTAIAVTETWLTETSEKSFHLPGYIFFLFLVLRKLGEGLAYL